MSARSSAVENRIWMTRGGQSASLKGGWQDDYAGILAIVVDVSRRDGIAFTPSEADRIVHSARALHGPDSLESGRAAGAAGLALLVGLHPGWRFSVPLLAEAHRIHQAWHGPRHCSVFLLAAFLAAARAMEAPPRGCLYSEAALKRRLDAAVEAGGPCGPQLGAALTEAGLTLMLAGKAEAGRAMLNRASGVHGILLGGPSHPVPSICRALSNDPLLWGSPVVAPPEQRSGIKGSSIQ